MALSDVSPTKPAVLELGTYLAPAYAGMLLAEQGYPVTKWWNGHDPMLDLVHGADLWRWVCHGKTLIEQHPCALWELPDRAWPHMILDNFRPTTLHRWGLDPGSLALEHDVVWVSLRAEVGEHSFDLLAQCRSILSFCPWVPFYLGDTVAGLLMAFKAVATHTPGHYVLGHASCLQKIVEGELLVPVERHGAATPWDPTGTYRFHEGRASILYKGQLLEEVPRDFAWRWAHLWHDHGRIRI